MKPYTFRVIIEPEKPRGYHGFVPLLPGLHTSGNTLGAVKKNLKEAIICHVQGILKEDFFEPPTRNGGEVFRAFESSELYPKKFLAGLSKGIKESGYFS
jgi:predicted RNase H-like HicB family nuclease